MSKLTKTNWSKHIARHERLLRTICANKFSEGEINSAHYPLVINHVSIIIDNSQSAHGHGHPIAVNPDRLQFAYAMLRMFYDV